MSAFTFGWAGGLWPRQQHLACVDDEGAEPTTAVVDWWGPPNPPALDGDRCEWIIREAQRVPGIRSGNGHYHVLGSGLLGDLIGHVRQANELWWRLDVDTWYVAAKCYRAGDAHPRHQDWVPGHSARRKIVGAWQLSEADGYAGGDVVVSYAHHRLTVPRARGTVYCLPMLTVHEVEPVTAGERWSVIVNGYGPPLR